MGSLLEVRCASCRLTAENIGVGCGMNPMWRFFEVRLFYCERCETLRSAKVLQRARALKAALGTMDLQAWSVAYMTPGEPEKFELKPSELATLLLDARRRPQCRCKAALRGSVRLPANADGEDTATCPRCGEDALVATELGCWD